MPGFSFPPNFTIPTPHDFISSCGKTGITTPEKAYSSLKGRVFEHYAYPGYGMFLVSRQTDDGMQPVGTVSLTRGIPPGPHYLAPDIGVCHVARRM
ncbi:hypothetical protein PENFLA_c027G06722 [Penicillium flavigenum]|uniref:Uncharacterized protein n=1 Tax=Penicillium flavigenum TaxID=254877 RepID=A0A1V6SR47_9EURO|nr:hypothetical protein PENFLA_c027G06722 [Penicillium flavigenum]